MKTHLYKPIQSIIAFRMNNILVPIDFSENSLHALDIALKMASKSKAKMHLLHVNMMLAYQVAFPEYPTMTEIEAVQYLDEAKMKMNNLKVKLIAQPENANISIETDVISGFLHPVLEEIIGEKQIDLIVMGTKGTTNSNSLFVGSNTEKVIRNSPCPVLVIPAASGTFFLETVVFSSTLTQEQLPAFKQLALLQQLFNFEVKILYMKNPGGFQNVVETEQALYKLASVAGLEYSQVFTAPIALDEEKMILDFAQKEEADLIVMATHQRKGFSHLLFGSLTENTANHSNIPVLSIPTL